MSEPDKKEKPKKKKSVKGKEDADHLSAESEPAPDAERKGSVKESKSRKASTIEAPENEPRSRKPSTADTSDKEAKSRKSSTAIDPEKRGSKTRKASNVTDGTSSVPAPAASPVDAVDDEEEEDDEMPYLPPPPREWQASETPFKAIADAESIDVNAPVEYFKPPPETSKTDIQLLQDLDTRRLAELMEAFIMFDFDQDGVISASDLRRTFASIDKPDVADEDIHQMLSEGLNPLDFDAFIVLMGYKTLELDAEEVLTDALSQWDYGTEGLISEDRIRHDLMSFGDKFTEEEALAALEDAPVIQTKNKERMINYVKFSNDLCGLRKRMKDYKKTGKIPNIPD